jgi:putative ABC transport system substrate-binding protein
MEAAENRPDGLGLGVATRRTLISAMLAAALLALVLPLGGQAQQLPRVGILWIAERSALRERHGAFEQGLRDLGWVNGQNFFLEARFAGGKADRLPDLAQDLAARHVHVIVAPSAEIVSVVRRVTATIPIVMANVHDPVALGFVKSLARPRGNVTGLATLTVELGSKNLELLREVLPKLSRVAVVVNPANPAARTFLSDIDRTAGVIGVKVIPFEARSLREIESVFPEATKQKAEGLLVSTTEGLFFGHRRLIAELALRYRLPLVIAPPSDYVEAGALLGYGSSSVAMFRDAARYVDRILKGAKPAELPVERPTKFQLFINLRTAGALGLTIPPSLLVRADKVVE